MSILLWLLPALMVTCVASAWAAWMGRGRPQPSERSEEAQARAQQRMAAALAKPLPGTGHSPAAPRERSTGVAVRRS